MILSQSVHSIFSGPCAILNVIKMIIRRKNSEMSKEDYVKAQRAGQKAYKLSLSQGQYPYLPVLDEILTHAQVDREVHLGTMYIPLNQVVGTSNFGRTQSFASNFMPLLDFETEFGTKWSNLADIQINEGIRDAVKVYEYMNKYYAVEGNKRVSVLKYFNAPSILASVTRKVPKRTSDIENRVYYEYMDFFAVSQVNYILFKKPGQYMQFLALFEKSPDEHWTEDDRRDLSFFHANFEKAFMHHRGFLPEQVTLEDALLLFLSLYSWQESKDASYGTLLENLEKIWPEVAALGESDSVELMMDPAKEKTTVGSVFNKILPQRKRLAAFVYDKSPEASDWIYGHELGRLHLEEALGDSVETSVFMTDPDNDNSEELLEQICSEHFDIIFTVTPKMIRACLKAAADHPEVIILNCALNSSYNTVRTYYTRMYEAKFLTGMIAGALSENIIVGYIADYPLYGAAASINAFALGAKMVNPHAKVYLSWSSMKNVNVDDYFLEGDISYISDQDMITPQMDNRHFGLYQVTDYGKVNLAMSIYNWGAFYEKLISNILRGSWHAEESVENKAINYWWGLSAGVTDVICSKNIPVGTLKLIELMKQNISAGTFHPFSGPLQAQDGTIHYESDEIMKPEDIMRMDWLVENVVGHIPTIDELKEEAQPVVKLRGLYSATAETGGNSLL